MAQRGKGRKFFQQMQPTFSIDLPQTVTTKLEFLDHSDPAKDVVVRKKAREWVNKNKESLKQSHGSQARRKARRSIQDSVSPEQKETQQQLMSMKYEESVAGLNLARTTSIDSFDPFGLLPDIGRKYDHIIQFFLTGCPEEIPCSDDKYSDKSKHSLIPFSSDNTVLGNMAKSKFTFILWLYATVSIRDSMGGSIDTEEVRWYCHQSLKVMQETLKKEIVAGEYSNQLLNSLACITATAVRSSPSKLFEGQSYANLTLINCRASLVCSRPLKCTAMHCYAWLLCVVVETS